MKFGQIRRSREWCLLETDCSGFWGRIEMLSSNSCGYDLASPQPIEIRVYDADLRPVDRGVGSIKKQGLAAGIYRLELRAGASSSDRLIKLQPGQIYTDHSLHLAFSSVLPLPS